MIHYNRVERFTKILIACAAAPLALLTAETGYAATYRVGPERADTTLSAVASRLAPGDVVEVDGGATYEGGVVFDRHGKTGAAITIRGVAAGGALPRIAGGNTGVEFAGDHYVLENFEITGGKSRCVLHHADDITIRDTVVHDCPAHGILGADEDSGSLTLDGVEVYASGSGAQKHPIYIATDESAHPGSVFRMTNSYLHDNNGGNGVKSRAERNEIHDNWIEGSTYRELELIGPDGQDPALAREDSNVSGNVFKKTNSFIAVRLGGDGTGETYGRYTFTDNTFLVADKSKAIFQLFDGIESVAMERNTFYSTDGSVRLVDDADADWATGKRVIRGSGNWVQKGSADVPDEWTGTTYGTDPGAKKNPKKPH
jgi:phage baseplate assembly protein gpV